jgi:hypothetical protein
MTSAQAERAPAGHCAQGQYRPSARLAPMSEEFTVRVRIYLCSVRAPKSLVPAEFVMDPAPAPFG